ncbi:hypothetical protein VTK26DRAFT_3218 [Humicola hyalothermophila]
MASFFQAFRSSLMPKRLLRFALSRLDLLDTDALDLENLDFALGRNTVLEFRDVGLVLPKLEALLGLPPSFSLQKAKVLVLRVSIPMDFYTSPITAEIDGVHIRLRVGPKQTGDGKGTGAAGAAEVVPTAADLAQSFLETQPVAEKKKLEEAIAAESQDLAASLAISEPDSDDGSTFGTGQPLSLPAFMTDFLQGIVDRMQIRIGTVIFEGDVEVPVDSSAPAPELVTFQLSLETINVEGVTTSEEPADGVPTIMHKDGKRHILLSNIKAALISEANVFSSLAASPSIPSTAASRSPVTSEVPNFPNPVAALAKNVSSDLSAGSDDLSQSHYPLQDSEDALNIPYELGENTESGEAGDPSSPLSTPRASIYRDSSPPLLREQIKSTLVERQPEEMSSLERQAQSEPFLRPSDGFALSSSPSPEGSVHSGSARSSSGSAAAEDLAESHLYSHEDAESMYMSAFSEAESVRLRGPMPGSWDAPEDPLNEAPRLHNTEEHPTVPSATSDSLYVSEKETQGGEVFAEGVTQHVMSPEEASTDPGNPYGEEPSPQKPEFLQDDIPTPRGPTRLVKEVLSLSSVSVYLPSTHNHVHVTAPDLGASISPHLPGAFSVHSSTPASPKSAPVSEPAAEKTPIDSAIEVVLKPLEVQFDASTAFLLAMVIGRLLEAARGESIGEAESSTSKGNSNIPNIKLSVEQLSVHFLEKLAGIADTPTRIFETQTADLPSDILLHASLEDVEGSVSSSGPQTEANVGIGKLRFGYANDDIISFDRSAQLFESVATTFPSAGNDISIKVTTTSDHSRVEVNTLPLHVKLDFQRLDETFSWFGGLSSFLNMGSSVTSNMSKGGKAPTKPAQKPRGVRFEAPISPDDRTAARENKTDLRINGLRVDVIGKECSVVLNTSALKLVNREEGVGIHFSRIRLSGPYLKTSRAEPPILAEVVDTRLEYVLLPRTKDLERLLELITPSKIKFDENEDEIMVDTLLRQRRKGSVLCLTVGKVRVDAGRLEQLSCLPGLADDLAKLGTVAKYLPEDDRPGLLTLCHVKDIDCVVDIGGRLGAFQAALTDLEIAHITVPSLVAVALGTASVTRNEIEELVLTSPVPTRDSVQKPPVLMMRMIDDIEPVLKVRLMGLDLEYRVPTVMDVLDLAEDATPEDFEATLAASVANLGDQAQAAIRRSPSESLAPEHQTKVSKPIKVDVAFRDCLVGLNPLGLSSKLTIVLTDANLEVTPGTDDTLAAVAGLKRAAILLVDDVSVLDSTGAPFASTRRPQTAPSAQVIELCKKGYVNISQISSARVAVNFMKDAEGEPQLDVEVRDDLLVLETCADSTQTLISLANALTPPTPPSKEIKYRTSVVPVKDLLASITADAFGKAEGEYDFDKDFAIAQELGSCSGSEDDFYGGPNDSPLNVDSQYLEGTVQEALFDATSESILAEGAKTEETSDGVLLSTNSSGVESSSEDLSVQESYFEQRPAVHGTAHRWNSKKNTYDHGNDSKVRRSPLRVSVRDVHVIWHLFDGYDWARTREVITKAVRDVEAKAHERRARVDRRGGYDPGFEEEEAVIDDFLFNSIYIGIPTNRDPKELSQAINNALQDAADTETIATASTVNPTRRASGQHSRSKSLKLSRSRHHKVTFELKGVNVDLVVFPPDSGETVNSVDLRVHDLDIFDHVPESTWKKFAMYDQDAGEREQGASMIHLELLNTKPVPSTPATEIVMKLTVLPLRLHVDQDALDFITRFFEFRDDSVPVHTSPGDIPFIQRAEINDIPVRLDFKPKRVDYAGLRSGRTTEFMNFMILEDARMVLRHVILYGVSGFDRLGKQLNDIWMDNVKRTQLPGVLAGLGPVRSLVNAGSGFRDLIEIPIREYRKDGRIVRSIRKGATAFAKTTGIEAVKLGAKLAIGTQSALQGAEGLLVSNPPGSGGAGGEQRGGIGDEWDYDEEEEDGTGEGTSASAAASSAARRATSLYADQPLGIVQGVRGAYAGLARDLSLARDAIIAVPAEVMETGSAQGAAKVVLRRAPTIILRPAIGATKAIGQTLLGATNSLDPMNVRRVDAKYKKH